MNDDYRLDPDSSIGIYDRNGVRMFDMTEYGRRLVDMNYKIVRHTKFPKSGVLVSTCWLGMDHNHGFSDDKRPIIFETMVFGLKQFEGFQERYHTEEEARAGHELVLSQLPKRVTKETPEEFEGFVPLTGGWL